jgi:subtilisin family serine protease
VIEVEFVPEVEDIDAILAGINLPAPTGGPSGETDFANVARTHGVSDARPVFTREQVEEDRARRNALRDSLLATPGPQVRPGQLSRLEQMRPPRHYVRLRFPPGTSTTAVITALKAVPQVKRAIVVPGAAPPSFPTDEMIGTSGSDVDVDPATLLEKQWYLHRTRVPQAWQHTLGEGVVIIDVDFGCRISHRELVGAIERTYNSFDGTDHVRAGTQFGHGTAVLGIAGARSNGQGIAGYAPKASLWAIQGNTGTSQLPSGTPWSDAIRFAKNTDAGGRRKVILVELETGDGGNFEQLGSINEVIRQAIAENCVVVVAAGNGDSRVDLDDSGQPFEPTGSILVGATVFDEHVNRRADFSNYGDDIVVSAPGDLVHDVTCGESTDDAYWNAFGGTSGAAAKVAGTVALMLSVNRHLSHDEVRDILRTTGSNIIPEAGKPIGRFLNAEAAVVEALNRLPN